MSNGLSQSEKDALTKGGSEPQEAASTGSADDSGQVMLPDEIAALLGEADAGPAPEEAPGTDDGKTMAADEIAALLADGDAPDEPGPPEGDAQPEPPDYENKLSAQEKDALGEIGNISMGTAATTLFAILNRKVEITTPRVTVTTMNELAKKHPMPFVSVEVKYTSGLEGTNCLFLRDNDVKIITDLMMGGDGSNIEGPLNDMHVSCVSEVMNQMVGASSTALSQVLKKPIDISPPKTIEVMLKPGMDYPFHDPNAPIVRTAFTMVVEGLIDSEIMQITPIPFAKDMVVRLMGDMLGTPPPAPPAEAAPSAASPPQEYRPAEYAPHPAAPPPLPDYGPQQQPYAPQPPPYAPQPQAYAPPPAPPVDVHPAQFASFGETSGTPGLMGENMDMLLDVPLAVSVELGKSRKYIKDILDFNVGTIVVLDKMAGDLVDVMVNGKLIAQGEVVVIDDSYGCRITEIVSPSKRINPLK